MKSSALAFVLVLLAAGLPVTPAQVSPPDVWDEDPVSEAERIVDEWLGDDGLIAPWLDMVAPPPGDADYQEDDPPNGYGDLWEEDYMEHAWHMLPPEVQEPLEAPMAHAMDLDGDGLSNLMEYRWNHVPVGPFEDPVTGAVLFPNGPDYDRDGWLDGDEVAYWNDPSNDEEMDNPAYAAQRIAVMDPDRRFDFDGDGLPNVEDVDADNDGLLDGYNVRVTANDSRYAAWPGLDAPQRPILYRDEASGERVFFGEQTYGTRPDARDSDGDGLEDGGEVLFWQALSRAAWSLDWDRDGAVSNLADADADGDAVPDGREPCGSAGTCAWAWDTDKDGLLDGASLALAADDPRVVLFTLTHVASRENANGTRTFLGESEFGTDPLGWDADGDGLPDGWEALHGLDPLRAAGRDGDAGDPDADAGNAPWTNLDEYAYDRPAYWDEARDGAWWRGTFPTVADTDWDDVTDGVEVEAGTDPVEDVHDDYDALPDPTGNDELEYVDPVVDAYLRAAVAEAESTVTGTVPLPDNLSELPQFAEETVEPLVPEALREPVFSTWTTAETGVEETLACVNATKSHGDASRTPGCVVNATRSLATGLVDALAPLADEAIDTLDALSPDALHARIDAVTTEHVPFEPPTLEQLAGEVLEPGGTNLGPATWPRGVPDPGDVDGPYVAPWRYADTPWPRFLASTLEDLGVPGLFGTVAQVDGTLGEHAELVATVDAGFLNLLVENADGTVSVHANVPIGVPWPVDADANADTGVCVEHPDRDGENVCGVDLTAQVLWMPSVDDAALVPQLTVKRLTDAPVRARVAAFVQLPNTPHVLALGVDARPDETGGTPGLPREVTVRTATNPLAQTAGAAPGFTFSAESTTRVPLAYLAALWQVDTRSRLKTPVPGELAQVKVAFPLVPRHVEATLSPDPAGRVGLEWRASATSDAVVGAKWHRQGARMDVAATVEDLPRYAHSVITRNATRATIEHDALAVIPRFTLAWDGVDENGTRSGGATTITDLPLRLRLDADASARRFAFDAEPALGTLEASVWRREDGNTEACHRTSGEFVIARTGPDACLTASLSQLSHVDVHADESSRVVRSQRAASAESLFVDMRGAFDLHVNAVPWPANVDVRITAVPGILNAGVTLSEPLQELRYGYRDGPSTTEVSGSDLPARLEARASRAAGLVTLTASDRVGDFAALQTEGRDVSLGDADGVIMIGHEGVLEALHVRLRNISSARFSYGAAGVTLTSDSESPHPFHVRYAKDNEWLNADLPRLPRDLSASYEKRPDGFHLEYTASERILELAGRITLGEATAAVHLGLKDFPLRLDVNVNRVQGTASLNASHTIGRAEVALTGPEHELLDVADWAHYVDLDLVDTVDLAGHALPRFHVKVTDLRALSARFGASGAEIASTASSPGNVAVRYRATEGWLTANASVLPEWARFDVEKEALRWNATRGTRLSLDAALDLTLDGRRYAGRLTTTDAPDAFAIAWNSTRTEGRIRLEHDAATFPAFLADFLVPHREAEVPARVRIGGTSVPGRVDATVDRVESALTLNVTHADGTPAHAGQLEAAYATDAGDLARSLPRVLGEPGGVAYARFPETSRMEAYVRLPHVSHVSARLTPDPETGRAGISYDAAQGTPFTVDVEAAGGTILRARALDLPATFRTEWLSYGAGAVVFATHAASGPVGSFDLEFTREGRTFLLEGSLPRHVNLTKSAMLMLDASEPVDLLASFAPTGENARYEDVARDYIVGNLEGDAPQFSVRVHGLTHAVAAPGAGRFSLSHAAGNDTYVHVTTAQARLVAHLFDVPADVSLSVQDHSQDIDWFASARTGNVSAVLQAPGQILRLDATGVPSSVHLTTRPDEGVLSLHSGSGEAFDHLHVQYAGDGSGRAPELDKDGFAIEFTQGGDGEVPRVRAAVRLAHVKAMEVVSNGTLAASIERTAGGERFTGHVRSASSSADIVFETFPAHVRLDVESTGPGSFPDQLNVTLNGHGEPLGDVNVSYNGPASSYVRANATNLPNRMTAKMVTSGEGRHELDVDGGHARQSPDPSGLTLKLATRNGTLAEGHFTAIPRAFTLARDARNASFTSADGALTGTLLVVPRGAEYTEVPEHAVGAFVDASPENRYASLRVKGLRTFTWERDADGRHATFALEHARRVLEPLRVSVENATHVAKVNAHMVPQRMDVTLVRSENHSTATYSATRSLLEASVSAREKEPHGEHVTLDVRGVPEWFTVDLDRAGNRTTFDMARGYALLPPVVDVDVRGPRAMFVKAHLTGVPDEIHASVDPDALPGPEACRFRATTTGGAIGDAQFAMGHGRRAYNPSLHRSTHWIGLNIADAAGVTVDTRLHGFREAALCMPRDEAFDLTLDFGGTPDLAASVRDADWWLDADVAGVPEGAYTLSKVNGTERGFRYDGAGRIARLDVNYRDQSDPGEPDAFLMGRALESVALHAEDVAPTFGVTTQVSDHGTVVTLDSDKSITGLVDLNIRLRHIVESTQSSESDDTFDHSRILLDGGDLRADQLVLRASDSGTVEMYGSSGHRVAFKLTPSAREIGVDTRAFRGGSLEMQKKGETGLVVEVGDLALAPGLPLHVRAAWQTDEGDATVLANLAPTPAKLRARVSYEDPLQFGAQLQSSDPIDRLKVTFGQVAVEVYGIPAAVDTTVTSAVGGALMTRLGLAVPGARVEGLRVSVPLRDGVSLAYSTGQTGPFEIAGDLDGALRYPGAPAFLQLKSPEYTNGLHLLWTAGDRELAIGGTRVSARSSTMLALYHALTEDADVKANGCEDGREHKLSHARFRIDGLRYDVPHHECEEWWE